ncbi:MAG TPA: EamA family transporter [Steroidobacteraceae bacterium]|jgi:drug/metabolite transporter (DMT)-like permease|nr:EamA family transporter [Steroidobacteraceae bacterium]
MSNLGLYTVAVLIWGSTWLVIKFQLGVVSPVVSVAWRFALAAVMLLAYSAFRRRPLIFSARDHLWIALQGVLMFGLNYIGVYLAEQYLTSGLVAVVFSIVVSMNAVGMRLFFSQPIRATTIVAALIGVVGVALVFWPELRSFSTSAEQLHGLELALGATATASLGNMVAARIHRRRLPVMQINAWAMLYGAVFVGLVALASGQRFAFDVSWPYVASLLYLSLFGSALAFGAYLTLMRRIGADRASYTAVAIPVVALLLSSVFEQMRWQFATFSGVALCVAGNVLMLRRRPG